MTGEVGSRPVQIHAVVGKRNDGPKGFTQFLVKKDVQKTPGPIRRSLQENPPGAVCEPAAQGQLTHGKPAAAVPAEQHPL